MGTGIALTVAAPKSISDHSGQLFANKPMRSPGRILRFSSPLRRLVDALTKLAEGAGAPVVAYPDPGGWTVGVLGDGSAHLYGEVLDNWSSWSGTKDRGSWRRQVP